MLDLLDTVEQWRAAGRKVAIARVVDVEGSGPRAPGASMAVDEDGRVAGSVSGGCVEGAVVSEALGVLSTGAPRLCTFGFSDDDAFAVGLTCGGTIRVFVELSTDVGTREAMGPGEAPWGELAARLRAGLPAAVSTVVSVEPGTRSARTGGHLLVIPGDDSLDAGETLGTLGTPELDKVVARDALEAIHRRSSSLRRYGGDGKAGEEAVTVFVHAFPPRSRMVIFGAVDFSAALARIAKVLGYWVAVCDARATFATAERFPMVDQVVVQQPERYLETIPFELGPRDAVCVLTHDHKFDVPAIAGALRTPVGYVGAMGSRRTTADRAERLRSIGVDETSLQRVMAPIGLDIGARTPEETAVAICAEIIARRGGGSLSSLRDTSGSIHHPEEAGTAGREAPGPPDPQTPGAVLRPRSGPPHDVSPQPAGGSR